MIRTHWLRLAAAGVLLLVPAAQSSAQTAANVLVIANANSRESVEIADYYATKRAIPREQILRLKLPVAEEIARDVYDSQLELPITDWLYRNAAQDRILYIVLTKGVPLRIPGTAGTKGTVASVDSELTLLYRKFTGVVFPLNGWASNPYFLDNRPVQTAKPFSHRDHDIYLVTRLDGFSVADVKALIDRAAAPSRAGSILLDARREASPSIGNQALDRAASALKTLPGWADRVILDTRLAMVTREGPLLGYYSWGTNDPYFVLVDSFEFQFAPGALTASFVSTDARTFQEPPGGWKAGLGTFAGTSQSLIGVLIRQGVTGAAGHVAEPYLTGAVRPDILFPAYASGFNLVEAFYLAIPYLGWQTVVIGDPLCAPFRDRSLASGDANPGVDTATEWPVFLSERRIRVMAASGLKDDTAKLLLRAEARLLRNDADAARQALERATAAAPDLTSANFTLANLYLEASQWDAAIERYRRVIARSPNDAISLNNLAFALAERKNAPAEALPFAQRAYKLNPRNATIVDTLGWIHHLLGDDKTAEPLMQAAANAAPGHAEIQLRAAIVLAATGRSKEAAERLERALRLDGRLAERPEVAKLKSAPGIR